MFIEDFPLIVPYRSHKLVTLITEGPYLIVQMKSQLRTTEPMQLVAQSTKQDIHPQFAESGIWQLTRMILEDQAGNVNFINVLLPALQFNGLSLKANFSVPVLQEKQQLTKHFRGYFTALITRCQPNLFVKPLGRARTVGTNP